MVETWVVMTECKESMKAVCYFMVFWRLSNNSCCSFKVNSWFWIVSSWSFNLFSSSCIFIWLFPVLCSFSLWSRLISLPSCSITFWTPMNISIYSWRIGNISVFWFVIPWCSLPYWQSLTLLMKSISVSWVETRYASYYVWILSLICFKSMMVLFMSLTSELFFSMSFESCLTSYLIRSFYCCNSRCCFFNY